MLDAPRTYAEHLRRESAWRASIFRHLETVIPDAERRYLLVWQTYANITAPPEGSLDSEDWTRGTRGVAAAIAAFEADGS